MKITKYFLSLAAAVGMIAGCQKPEMVQISAPEDVVAPVLQGVEDINITADNLGLGTVTFNWSDADFGALTQIDYAIEVAKAGKDGKTVVTSGITTTSAEVSYEALNAILLYDLELASGVSEKIDFYVSAKVGEYAKVYSAPVSVSATVTAAEKQYPKLYIVGSYNGWSHDSNQYIFDFTGDDTVYQGMIDFGADHASNEFKITAGGWGNDEHSMSGPHDAESKTIAMVVGGGDNINVWQAKRYYHLTFDRALTMTADVSFDQIGVIGDFNSWGGDVVMSFNPVNQKFYADVEFPADGGFKFRLDADWAVSYGSTGSGVLDSGDNIPVTAGKYRVYLNMNNFNEMTYELNAAMYGQEEAGPDVPDTPDPLTWVVNGNFNGWGGEPVISLTNSGDLWTAKKVKFAAVDEFKLTSSEGAWVGGPEANAQSTIDPANPYDVYKPVLGEAFATGDMNIAVGAEGEYDIVYDAANSTITVTASKKVEGWGVVGQLNGWSAEAAIPMTQNGSVWSAAGVELKAGEGWKLCFDGSWDVNRGATGDVEPFEVALGEAVVVCHNGKNLSVAADGTYDIYYHEANEEIYVVAAGSEAPAFGNTWYLVGGFNSWTVADAAYMMKKEGEFFVFRNFVLEADNEVKFNAGNWDVNRGGLFSANAAIDAVPGGDNLKVAAGTYDVYLSLAEDKIYFMTDGKTPADAGEVVIEYIDASAVVVGLSGSFNGWGDPADAYLAAYDAKELTDEATFAGTYTYKFAAVELTNGAEFKFRINGGWFGYAETVVEGLTCVDNGGNIAAGEGGTFNVVLTFVWDGLAPSEIKAVFSK